jgi:hypothetical protein
VECGQSLKKQKKSPLGSCCCCGPDTSIATAQHIVRNDGESPSHQSRFFVSWESRQTHTHTRKKDFRRPIRQDKGLGYVYFSLASGSHVTARARVTAYLGICVYRDTHQQQQRSYISHIARKNDRNNSLFAPAQYIKWTSGSV